VGCFVKLGGQDSADSLETTRGFRLDSEYYYDFHREDSMAMLHLHYFKAISLVEFSAASHCSGFIRASLHNFRGAAFTLYFADTPSSGAKASAQEQSISYLLKN
jgi:hypothetical protein